MLDLIRRARRRLLQHGLFEQAINALSVAFGGAAVLLLSGAGSLGWFGAAAATAGAAVVGLWLARRRLAIELLTCLKMPMVVSWSRKEQKDEERRNLGKRRQRKRHPF